MKDPSEKKGEGSGRIIHLGTFTATGPGTFALGVAKLWADPERDLLSAAESFRKAADRCLNSSRIEDGVEMLTVPGVVCAALSCELFLKYVTVKERGVQPRKHKLDELFSEWSAEAQAALLERRPDIREVFERNRDHFADARYHHEKEQFSFRQQEILQAADLLAAFVGERFRDKTA